MSRVEITEGGNPPYSRRYYYLTQDGHRVEPLTDTYGLRIYRTRQEAETAQVKGGE